jgi:hypothetical protein
MIGLGPHTMSTADWVFVAILQVGLVLAAVFAVYVAVQVTRPRSGR